MWAKLPRSIPIYFAHTTSMAYRFKCSYSGFTASGSFHKRVFYKVVGFYIDDVLRYLNSLVFTWFHLFFFFLFLTTGSCTVCGTIPASNAIVVAAVSSMGNAVSARNVKSGSLPISNHASERGKDLSIFLPTPSADPGRFNIRAPSFLVCAPTNIVL